MKDWYSTLFGSYVEQVIEQQKRYEKLMKSADPLRHYRTAMDEINRAALATKMDAVYPSLSVQEYLCDAVSASATTALARQIEDQLTAHSTAAAALEALTQATSRDYIAAFLQQRDAIASTARSLGRYQEEFTRSQQQIQAVLASVEAAAQMYTLPDLHWSNTLGLISSYEVFALDQAKKARSDNKTIRPRRARITELAGGLLASSVGASEAAVSTSSAGEAQIITQVRTRLWSPLNQHLGFVYRAELTVEVDAAFGASLPVEICQVGAAIVALLIRINEHSRLAGGDDVFRPTNRFVTAATSIPVGIVGSDAGFGEIVNALYFLLYEACGDGKRILPLSSDSELAPLWRVKHLRLRYDHDIEHGNSAEIRSKYEKIAAAFQSLIGKNSPTRSAEWTRGQAQLYRQLYEMLVAIEQRMNDTKSK